MEFTKELIGKAKECKTAEEILVLAKEKGYELSLEEAGLFLQDFEEGELTDEELDNVAGGAEGCKPANPYEDVYWEKKEDVQFIFNIGDIVEAYPPMCAHHTATCKVINRVARSFEKQGYADLYQLEKQPGVRSVFTTSWHQRSGIEK